VLAVQSYVPTTRYVESEKAVLTFVSQHVAAAIEHKRAIVALRASEESFRQLFERNRHLAFHDALTALPNRTLLNDRLELALARSRRDKTRLAIVYPDLDHLKEINASLGHNAGDGVLQEISERLRACVRQEDTIARVGGDEFVLLFNGLESEGDATLLGRKIL